jgi:hypothetical protein
MPSRRAGRGRAALSLLVVSLAAATLACGREADPSQIGQLGGESQSQAAEATAENSAPAVPQVAPSPTQPAIYAIGDDIHIGDWNLAVLGWSEVQGSGGNVPRSGERFVAVDAVFINVAQGPRNLSPLLQMSLKDSTNRKYTLNLAAQTAAGMGLPSGEVNPGERVRGVVGFQIPLDATGLTFVFDAAVIGTGKVVVALGDQPQSLDAPSGMMPGEQTQAVHAVGEAIDAGNLRLTVHALIDVPGTTIFYPDSGAKFVAVDLTLQNIGNAPQNVSSLLQMSLKDASGQRYDLHLGAQAAAGASPPDGELSPGESLRGQVAYQVPEGAQGLVFTFDPNLVGYGKVQVALP